MNKRLTTQLARPSIGMIGALALLAASSGNAFADHDRHERDRYERCDVEKHVHHHYYENDRHRTHYRKPKHHRQVQVHNHYYGQDPYANSGGGYYQAPRQSYGYRSYAGSGGYGPNFGNAVGGALGGYVGSQIGSGSGNHAATAAGAILGYALGGRF